MSPAFERPLPLMLVLGLLSLLPFLFMSASAFVKISTVLQITKNAIGAQSVPSNSIVMALSLALSLLVMAPVGERMLERASPIIARNPDSLTLLREGSQALAEPLRDFLRSNASPREQQRFLRLAQQQRPAATRAAVDPHGFSVLLPAFMVSELHAAFALGFAIYLPFLVLDLVVANVLLALGMQMVNPSQISLPFKLLLFVALDGWGLLAQSLLSGYRVS